MKRRCLWLPVLALCAGVNASPQAGAAPKPVYIFLSTTVSDHINADMSEDRLRRILPLLEKYRAQSPTLGATILFSGAMSEYLQLQNDRNHLLDYVKGFAARGIIDPGYDGADEPTYQSRPLLAFKPAATPEDRWHTRVSSAESLLTTARDPLTGEVRHGQSGGLLRMQEALGTAAFVRGVTLALPNMYGPVADIGADTEIVHELRRFNDSAVMQGVPDADAAHTGSSNYRGWTAAFSKALSPSDDTSPELYWQDNVLRTSEASEADMRLFHASDGPEKLSAVLKKLDRSRIRILHIDVADLKIHAKPEPGDRRPNVPLRYAYTHLDNPKYPAELRHTPAEIDAGYAAEEGVLRYLATEFIPANPGSRFVSSTDLRRMAGPGWGYSLPATALRTAVGQALRTWEDHVPPPFFRVDDHYLSLADMFGVLADALAEQNRTGRLPESVRVERIYGPMRIEVPDAEAPPKAGVFTASAVIARSEAVSRALRAKDPWTPMPLNAVPSEVRLGSVNLNPAEFLRLMAEALVAPGPQSELKLRGSGMFWGRPAYFYRRRPLSDMEVSWTFRPALIGPQAVK